MKVIYLVRHAKSSWDDPTLNDFDRPLNKRGKRDAPFMGKRLKEQGIIPDLLITSDAKRAQKTAMKLAEEMGYSKTKIVPLHQVYDSSESTLLGIIRSQKNKINSLMLVGHNPELTSFSNMLSDEFIFNIPTTGISCIRFGVNSWKEIEAKSGKQVFFDFPKRHQKSLNSSD